MDIRDPNQGSSLPQDLAEAQQQAVAAIQAAQAAGYVRMQVDIVVPDIKPEGLARPLLGAVDPPLRVVFSDAGSSALAQRDWGELPQGVELLSLGAGFRLEVGIPLLFVVPAVYAVEQVEQICEQMGRSAPVILFNPQLQDAATVGVGLAGRQLRDRFITTFEPVYYLRALGSAALSRQYPHPWCVWQQDEAGEYQLVQTLAHKPSGEELAELLRQPNEGLWTGIRRFLRALQS